MKPLILLIAAIITIQTSPLQVLAASSPEAEASESAGIDSETIKENIKKRIEEAIKTQTDPSLKKIAVTGIISTITTNSFSVETSEGVKQASMSAAATTGIDLATSKEVSLTDVGIGDYVAALGYLSEPNKVLDARRILILKTPPAKPDSQTFFGSVVTVDTKKKIIEVANPKTAEQKTFITNAKSDLIQKDAWNHQEDITLADISKASRVLIIFEATDANDKPGKILSLTLKSETEIKSKLLQEETGE